jgi:hypothetical protein
MRRTAPASEAGGQEANQQAVAYITLHNEMPLDATLPFPVLTYKLDDDKC